MTRCPVILWACVCSLGLTPTVLGDGGQIRYTNESGPIRVTVFTDPTPPTIDGLDVSVMVLNDAGQPVPEAHVSAILTPPSGSQLHLTLDHAQADGPLLQAGSCVPDEPGAWQVHIQVEAGGQSTTASFTLQIQGPPPALAQIWPWLLPVPVALGLWVLTRKRDARVPA